MSRASHQRPEYKNKILIQNQTCLGCGETITGKKEILGEKEG